MNEDYLKQQQKKTVSESYLVIHHYHSLAYTKMTIASQSTSTSMFTVSLFTVARKQDQFRCPPTDEQIVKIWYLNNEILLNHKVKGNL